MTRAERERRKRLSEAGLRGGPRSAAKRAALREIGLIPPADEARRGTFGRDSRTGRFVPVDETTTGAAAEGKTA